MPRRAGACRESTDGRARRRVLTIGIVCLAALFVSWLVYPAFLLVAARAAPRAPAAVGSSDTLAALIVTRESAEQVSRRVDNLLASEGTTFEEVVVVLDWTIASTLPDFHSILGTRAHVLVGEAPGGKAAGLNMGMPAIRSTWTLLADSWQEFRPDAVSRLVRAVADGSFAAVSGRVAHRHDDPVMRAYWKYENAIRLAQSRLHSVVTTSGAISLVRTELWHRLPAGTICDDLFMTMDLVLAGHRVGYVPDALAIDSRRYSHAQVFQKKVRTLTGLWQLLRWKPQCLAPWRNPIWVHFVCHKLARLATPYLVILAVLGFGLPHMAYLRPRAFEAALASAVAVAFFWTVSPRLLRRWSAATAWAICLLTAPIWATYNGVRGNWAVWKQHSPGPGGTR